MPSATNVARACDIILQNDIMTHTPHSLKLQNDVTLHWFALILWIILFFLLSQDHRHRPHSCPCRQQQWWETLDVDGNIYSLGVAKPAGWQCPLVKQCHSFLLVFMVMLIYLKTVLNFTFWIILDNVHLINSLSFTAARWLAQLNHVSRVCHHPL